MTTAIQILSVERRLLTITLKYAIITAEKEFMRSRILDFLIASIFHRNGLDHIFDHLRLWTTWKQCLQEHPKASFSDTKAPKSLVNQAKNRYIFLWEHDVAGSNPVIPTKNADSSARKPQSRVTLRSFFLINLNPTALFFTIGGKHEQELHLSDFNKKLD